MTTPKLTPKLTVPQRFVLEQLQRGATLRSRPAAGVSPWLEFPGGSVKHVSLTTFAVLYDLGIITRDRAASTPTLAIWRLA